MEKYHTSKKVFVIKKGFTIIEVSLVLAITGLIFIGIVAGVNGSVARQRYNDVVQDVYSFIRGLYSDVTNPQGINSTGGDGHAGLSISGDRAIYGKIIIFGLGNFTNDDATPILEATVTGDANPDFAGADNPTLGTIRNAHLRILNNSKSIHNIPWGGRVETKSGSSFLPFAGLILILHSPVNGTVHTYFIPATHNNNGSLQVGNYGNISTTFATDSINNTNLSEFKGLGDNGQADILHKATINDTTPINLCINSPDLDAAGGTRRNIRISPNSHNISAIQLSDTDTNTETNPCK